MSERPRILTGDTPTGKLHLGHWVGSVRRRVELQESHDCFFILANMHAFTTRSDKPDEIRADTLEIVRDLLAMGIDPVWLGVLIAVNLQTSFLTPPFGFALFYLRGVTPPEVPTSSIYRGVVPYIMLQLVLLAMLLAWPGLATWLPGVIYG